MANLGNTIVNGALRVLNGLNVNTINGVTVGSSPKFTDTTYNFSGTTFYSGNSGTAEHNADNSLKNGHYYYTSNGPATSLGASTTDGALYVASHSDSWVGQIAQDYRNGALFVRGKNNGTWQAWNKVYDSAHKPSAADVGAATSGHTHTTSLATDSGTATVTLAANTTYKLTAGGTSVIFKTPVDNNTTYSSQAAASGGTAVSLVTTGEKYTWNNKSNLAIGTTATTAAAGNHTHSISLATDSGTNQLTLAANTKYKITAGGSSYIFTTPADNNTWRGIQNNLTSDSTTDSLSAAQGKALANGSARDSTKLPLAGGTMTGTLTAPTVSVTSNLVLPVNPSTQPTTVGSIWIQTS